MFSRQTLLWKNLATGYAFYEFSNSFFGHLLANESDMLSEETGRTKFIVSRWTNSTRKTSNGNRSAGDRTQVSQATLQHQPFRLTVAAAEVAMEVLP